MPTFTQFDPANPDETGFVKFFLDGAREKVAAINPGLDLGSPEGIAATMRTFDAIQGVYVEQYRARNGDAAADRLLGELARELRFRDAAA